MKKSLLSLSIGAFIGGLTLAGAANAAVSIAGTGTGTGGNKLTTTTATVLELNPGGIGHIGIIPYFSTQNGNHTLISITNTDATNGKAVKVRFRSAANSDDVFDFTLFLSPGDVWTADVGKDAATGLSQLYTADNSCTLPASVNGKFITDRLPPTFTDAQKAEWTREGYIEVLNMADVPPQLSDGTTTNPLFTATKHINGVAPCTGSTLTALATDNVTTDGAKLNALGLDTPSGGLYTNAFIINSANAYMAWSTEPTAVEARASAGGAPGRGNLVFSPQTGNKLGSGEVTNIGNLTADPLLVSGAPVPYVSGIVPLQFDFPDLSTLYIGASTTTTTAASQAAALSKALAVSTVKNDYSTLASIGSKTDFTFSMPTRRYAAAVDYSASPAKVVFNGDNPTYFTAANTTVKGNLACVQPGGSVTGWSRSEQYLTSGPVISPGTATTLQFCGEVSVLTVNNNPTNPAGNGVLGATVAVQNLYTGYQEGWINIGTPGLSNAGLPVLGSAYTSAVGAPAAGMSTNYSWTYAHKFTKAGAQ
ncbi:cell surface protein [Xylophilus sp. ASV27]|uniref:cell surface protein n=1 Tax=Xylophilus sp. ASV27 TaxID=2795129 RepID=UPI0018EBDCE0|nr:cell surface protein [Xylophilus sp. ASV27]